MPSWKLVLAEEAKLFRDGQPVAVRRRGLALLAILALDGASAREQLAGMLWRHGAARNNLRVELHALRSFFPDWATGEDPLRLPEGLEVARDARPLLLNLKGISPHLDARLWLWSGRQGVPLELPELEPPYVLLVRSSPLAERDALLAELLSRTGFDVRVLEVGKGARMREAFGRPDQRWVVLLPPYGEEPDGLEDLWHRLPNAAVHRVDVSPWTWGQVRESLLQDLPFTEAARLYLASGGDPIAIQEMRSVTSLLPPRVRAAFVRELRELEIEARRALEVLSVHPGPVPESVLVSLGLLEEAVELARARWLAAHGAAWGFRHRVGQRSILAGLSEGWRRIYHARFARAFAHVGQPFAAVYHAWMAGIFWPLPRPAAPWARAVLGSSVGTPLPTRAVPRGERLPFKGLREAQGKARILWVRLPNDPKQTEATFEIPSGPALLRLDGRVFARNPLRVGLNGDAVPLYLEAGGRRVDWAWVPQPVRVPGGALLPLNETFRHWVLLPESGHARVGTRAELGVFELELELYRVPSEPAGRPLVFAFPA